MARPSKGGRRRRWRGQALAEFAIVLPVLLALVFGIIQFGLVFWAQNTLTQVVRDTGRWEATQQSCTNASAIVDQANAIAAHSALFGYDSEHPWTQATKTGDPGVFVEFRPKADSGCPPKDNTTTYYVRIAIQYRVPTFVPGIEYLPALGKCGDDGCHIDLSSTAQYRLEPKP